MALARQPWVSTVLAVNRNEDYYHVVQHLMPENPSAAFIDAVDYLRSEVAKLHAVQSQRNRG